MPGLPLPLYDHHDPGFDADPSLKELLHNSQIDVKDIPLIIGTEVKGIQLADLGPEGEEQRSLFARVEAGPW
ncbi:hypothetical protein F1880_008941 [Penicillium rolfsii]|nr:hypothetical protein F1880_008941 [Penicillium rolfsii]